MINYAYYFSLAKIWGGSGLRKPCQTLQKNAKKVQRQSSQATDVFSTVSSESGSDEDNDASNEDASSMEEESLGSEESRDCEPPENLIKQLKKTKTSILKRYFISPNTSLLFIIHTVKFFRCEGMGSWSPNLTIRYNQDNQRDFEEKAAVQMVALLTKRTMLEYNLRSKTQSYSRPNIWSNSTQPIGKGSYNYF